MDEPVPYTCKAASFQSLFVQQAADPLEFAKQVVLREEQTFEPGCYNDTGS